MTGLELRHCSKSYGGKKILDDVSFSVERGEFCILLGPSGCGKSTLLRMIAGLETADGGEILIGGRDVGSVDPRDRDTAMVFQNYSLYPHLSVFGNLAFPLRLRGRSRKEIRDRVTETASLLGIEDLLERKPSQLSGGQQQRVAMGRAIVRNPALYLFDEPLSNLDARLRASMRIELTRIHRELGITTLYVTHDQLEAMTLGRKLVLIDGGRIQQIGAPRDIYDRPANIFAASFIGSPPMNLIEGTLERQGAAAYVSASGMRIGIRASGPVMERVGERITAGIRPESLVPGGGEISGSIELVEHTGDRVILHVRTPAALIVATAPSDYPGAVGDIISLSAPPDAVHLFMNGKRV